jgi:predicted metal-binding membrane protein
LFVAVGIMNVLAMLILTSAVLIEKFWSRGEAFARLIAIAALVFAVLVLGFPDLAPGLASGGDMG